MVLADDDPDRVCSSLPQQPTRNMVFDVKKDEKRGRRADIKLSRRNRYRNETQLNPEDGNTVSMENKSNDPGWQHFQDEDYIVFCFKEDGTFDVVKDSKSEEALELFDSGNRNPRPVIRKVSKDYRFFSFMFSFFFFSMGVHNQSKQVKGRLYVFVFLYRNAA